MAIDKTQIDCIVEFLKKKVSPTVIYLFGSAVTDRFNQFSDIDIAFLSQTSSSDYDLIILAQELADIINRDIDLIDLSTSSTVFKAEIITSGQIIFCSDENKKALFELYSLKEYALLNEEREVILNQIKRSKSVYGQ